MATAVMFESFSEQQLITPVDFNSDTLKFALTNTQPDAAANDFFNDITEISAGNGYSAGGETAAAVSVSRSGDTTKVTASDAVVTATGAVGPFQYVVLYKSTGTASTSTLIAYWALASAVTRANGDTFTIDINPPNGFLQATV